MSEKRIRVGIIGVNTELGWAKRAHIPALRSLPDYEITAVGTSRIESARAAADYFGVAHAFADARQLAEHPEVDLVAVTVKVPHHLELVQAALAAGKHVYCEWPLARTTEEAEVLASAAEAAGVHHAIGLQTRYVPAVLRARELIEEGYLGELTSVTAYSGRAKGAGDRMPEWAVYTLDRTNGAGTLEVAGGHTLDAVQHLTGELARVQAQLAVRRTSYLVGETSERVPVTSPDQVLLGGTLPGGAVVSAHIHDGKVAGAGTRVELAGTEGVLVLESTGPAGPSGIQMGELRLLGSRTIGGELAELPLPTRLFAVGAAESGLEGFHVAQLYARLAADLRSGERTVPDFTDGLRLHRLLDAVRRSDATGQRQRL
ncbi:Gfo/Idh/MocA family oxidoreductase [Kitasatospora acidiphila]|uniref:Gfo/Idh/MocA family oxidoreductase n=1 Tax=Kitasatospora acidiphila TaxID=2567942 RepID=A0A540WC93_9ACTN|nr:Gfo/Idh/MocA family oxidoreductase [Kitasatospora acidiphila]TQF06623.1 Gfo/Idh/MocA family oxidoreductase [Kitasatospora acidiphila]